MINLIFLVIILILLFIFGHKFFKYIKNVCNDKRIYEIVNKTIEEENRHEKNKQKFYKLFKINLFLLIIIFILLFFNDIKITNPLNLHLFIEDLTLNSQVDIFILFSIIFLFIL